MSANNLIKMDLSNGFTLERASSTDFAKSLSIYRENIWFRDSWEKRLMIVDENDPCYWIKKGNDRIGGVVLDDNCFMSFFTIPPFVDEYLVLGLLTKYLLNNTSKGTEINVYGILPSQVQHLLRFGYKQQKTRRCMIRPTDTFENIEWPKDYKIDRPKTDNINSIANLFYQSYDELGFDGNNTYSG